MFNIRLQQYKKLNVIYISEINDKSVMYYQLSKEWRHHSIHLVIHYVEDRNCGSEKCRDANFNKEVNEYR